MLVEDDILTLLQRFLLDKLGPLHPEHFEEISDLFAVRSPPINKFVNDFVALTLISSLW